MNNGLKRFFITFLMIAMGALICVAALIVYVDPFFHYHRPLTFFPYVVDDQVDMNPGLARHMDYDSVLLGSSMTVAFDTSKFADKMGLKTQKLSYNGAYPKDQSNIMQILFDAKPAKESGRTTSVDRVFLGIDELNYSADIEQTKYPITDYLYNDNILDDVNYIFNKDVLLDYVMRPAVDRKDASDWNTIYKMWWQPQHYNLANIRLYYTPAPEEVDMTPVSEYLDGIAANFDANILPYIEAHPDTTFTVFYPPYSILYWYDAYRQQQIDTIVEKYRYMTNRLLEYDNVEVFFFQNRAEIICDFNNYADYTHYRPEVCDWMVDCFSNGENKVTKDNLDTELELLRGLAMDYDYDSIDL
ncbi:MAG: hypothetical protein KBT19_00405 [Lachnospiraceae bacterium]|nr:hypothetical protein [Candidatus Colinaster equi]